jgi:hypothetical protein
MTLGVSLCRDPKIPGVFSVSWKDSKIQRLSLGGPIWIVCFEVFVVVVASLPHPNSAEALSIFIYQQKEFRRATRPTMKRKVMTRQCYSQAIESETVVKSSSSLLSSSSRSSLEDSPPNKRLRRSYRTIARTTNTNTTTTPGGRAKSQQQFQSPQTDPLQQPTHNGVTDRRLQKVSSSVVDDVSSKDPRKAEVEKEADVLVVGVIVVDPRRKGQHSESLGQQNLLKSKTTTDRIAANIIKDDDDDDDQEVVAGEEDDILGVWGHNPSRDLPHMRQHCTRYPFHHRPRMIIQKAEENSNCNPTQFTTTAADASCRPTLKNAKYCSGCYCYVCDVPAKECQQWVIQSPSDDEGHNHEEEDDYKDYHDHDENHDDETRRVYRTTAVLAKRSTSGSYSENKNDDGVFYRNSRKIENFQRMAGIFRIRYFIIVYWSWSTCCVSWSMF